MIAHTLVAGIPQHVVTVGRGFHYGTAFEIALKIRELAGVFTEAFSPADLRHGPIAAVRPGTPVFLIAPRGAVHEDMTELLSDLRQRRAACGRSRTTRTSWRTDLSFPIPSQPEWLSPFAAVVPGQLLAANLADRAGVDVDNPGRLSKVTKTL